MDIVFCISKNIRFSGMIIWAFLARVWKAFLCWFSFSPPMSILVIFFWSCNPLLSVIPCSFSHSLSISFQPLHSSCLELAYCFVSRGLSVCSKAKVIISVGTGSLPLRSRGPVAAAGSWTALHTSAEYWQERAVWGFTRQMRSQRLSHSAGIQTGPALILIQPSAFSTGCHCWPA